MREHARPRESPEAAGRPRTPHVGLSLVPAPDAGGTYQYNLSVARALAPLADRGWRLTAFAYDPGWRAELPSAFRVVVGRRSHAAVAASALYRWVDRTRGGIRRAAILHPGIALIDASDCDLVLFPSQEADAFLTRRRALVAIHDLMHRYESQFEEYRGREYSSRERHYRNLSERAAGILVDSGLGKRQVLESYGIAPEKVFVLPYAIPDYLASSREVDVRAKYGLFERYLFYPAQFWEHKNHASLLDAMAKLKAKGVGVKLVLCGSRKNAYERVVGRIAELDLRGDVTILGYVPSEDMYSLYKHAVATVFVSLIGPTSIPPLEAMFVGSPLVVSNVYAMPEQVGDAALLVDARSPEDIAAKVERVWSDEALRRTLADRGRAQSALWTTAHFGERLRAIVSELVRSEAEPRSSS